MFADKKKNALSAAEASLRRAALADPDILANFDVAFYASRYGPTNDAPLVDFLDSGWRKGYAPTPRHDCPAWRALVPNLEFEDLSAALARWPGAFDLAAVKASELFDSGHYAEETGLNGWSLDRLLFHYLTTGWRDGLDPSTEFSTSYYLETYSDVRLAGWQPLIHFLQIGMHEHRRPCPASEQRGALHRLYRRFGSWRVAERMLAAFDADYYLSANPDIARGGIDPLEHFLNHGWRERRDPSNNFSVSYYLTRNPESRWRDENPLFHYATVGHSIGLRKHSADPVLSTEEAAHREVSALSHDFYDRVRAQFDFCFYAECNPDVAAAGIDPFHHYLVFGWKEGRDPSPEFSTKFYLESNPGLSKLQINPFVHYVLRGRAEGRIPREQSLRNDAVPASADPLQQVSEEDLVSIAPFFDERFYLDRHPEVASLDPRRHYLALGWRQGYDPAPDFSTSFYIERYPDIARAGVPPLLHYARFGRAERRETMNYITDAKRNYAPLVSVIVPNYNHAPFLEQRLRSIADQTYRNIELIVLDDNSSDDSRAVIEEVAPGLGLPLRMTFNNKNSGGVFIQWRKGIVQARGDLIWICESDDFCEPDFLERIVPHFADRSVTMAFGRIQFSDAEGRAIGGLDAYREGAEAGIWNGSFVRPAAQWFAGAFGVNNVIANVGGCVFRNVSLPDQVWEEARTYRICGDWYLYIHIAGGGQIAYEPLAVSYFRQHSANTSAKNFDKAYYYKENMRILREIARHWEVPRETRLKFVEKVKAQYTHFGMDSVLGSFEEGLGVGQALKQVREVPHVQILFLGFSPGGGELFPINLANALTACGVKVSMLAMDMQSINQDMLSRLAPSIPVYQTIDVVRAGRAAYLDRTGISVLHSHMVLCESFLTELTPGKRLERPLIVTLHGSYAFLDGVPEAKIEAILANVDLWVYTADRNLEFFEARGMDTSGFVKLPNAMPADPRPAPFDRVDLGIGADDIVFTLVARGIKRKGWRASLNAFRRLRDVHGRRDVHLIMIGEGEAQEEVRRVAADAENVHFLGYVSEINGVFRLTDVVLLPTRFAGESYPLVLVQALQEGRPVIATNIGEIGAMISHGNEVAGVLLPNIRNSNLFFAALENALLEMLEPARRATAAGIAKKCASRFDMVEVARSYAEIYERMFSDQSTALAGVLPGAEDS
ncbi:glycosyltransferase [Faunimonas sp. B44]